MPAVPLSVAQTRQYDVIVVGGGTAGLVVAARLSEDRNTQVLIVEAGADRRGDDNIDTPGKLFGICGDPDYDWAFWSVPQTNIDGRELSVPRGKVLGGCSAINATIITHASPRDYEAWTRLGNQGWSAEEMRPYFRRAHTLHDASTETRDFISLDSYLNRDIHGTDGPLAVSYSDTYRPVHRAFAEAFEDLGFNDKSDPILGRFQGGFSPPNSVDPKLGQRSYAATAYYTNMAERRANVTLLTETFVERVVMNRRSDGLLEATGVQVASIHGQGDAVVLHARREVVLSAGTIHSPLILENSGIGGRSLLEQHGIEVLLDNPGVGENLQDHPFTAVSFEAADGVSSTDAVRDPAVIAAAKQQYNESRDGPLSGVALSIAFLPPMDAAGRMTDAAVKTMIEDHPRTHSETTSARSTALTGPQRSLAAGRAAIDAELEAMLLDLGESAGHIIVPPRQMDLKMDRGRSSTAQSLSQGDPRSFLTLFVGLNHPMSRGSVHLQSNKIPNGATLSSDGKAIRNGPLIPAVDPAVLDHPLDLELLARTVQFADSVAAQRSMQALRKPDGDTLPPEAVHLSTDLDVARRATRDRLWSAFHHCGTCAMMPRELGGVVSDRLMVHGTTNLRVVDASIFPIIPMCNIQSVVYTVAERASDIIKEDWSMQPSMSRL